MMDRSNAKMMADGYKHIQHCRYNHYSAFSACKNARKDNYMLFLCKIRLFKITGFNMKKPRFSKVKNSAEYR